MQVKGDIVMSSRTDVLTATTKGGIMCKIGKFSLTTGL